MRSYMPTSEYESESECERMPECESRCVGTVTKKYKIYEHCCHEIREVCGFCGHEYEMHQQSECPMCGAPESAVAMDDPPFADPDGFDRFGRFGRFDEFGRFDRFGFFPRFRFFPLFPIFPFFGFRRFRRFI